MSQFLRDMHFKNLTLEEDAIKSINSELVKIRDSVQGADAIKNLKLSYVIRFDNKGFVLNDFNELIEYIQSAKFLERIVFVLQSEEHIQSNKSKGKCVDMHFDSLDFKNCFVIVHDDDESWVDSIFLRTTAVVNKHSNKNFLVRNAWVTFLIQILGVFVGILFSLWMAVHFSRNLKIANPFGFTFLIAFVLFSNIWTYVYPLCLKAVDYLWPNMTFKNKGEAYALFRWVVSTVLGGLTLWMFGWLFQKIWSFAGSFFSK